MTTPRHSDELAELRASTGRIIRAGAAALDVGDTWAEDAATVVLSQPAVRDGLTALLLLHDLAAEHVPVPRRPGSLDVVCAKCGTGWVCELGARLGAAA